MKLLRDKDPRFQLLSLKVAAFVLSGLLVLTGVFVALGISRDLFVKTVPIHVQVGNSLEFKKHMAVMLSGFKIGSVSSLTLTDTANVDVVLDIEEPYMKWIRRDSVARIRQEGYIGDAYVEVSRGSPEQQQVYAEGEILFIPGTDLEAMAEDMRKRVLPIITDVATITHNLSAPDGDFNKTLSNLRQSTERLKGTLIEVDKTLKNSQQLMSASTAAINEDVRPLLHQGQQAATAATSTLNNLNQTTAALQQQLPPLLHKVDRSLDDVNQMTHQLQGTVSAVAPQLPALVSQGGKLMQQGGQTLQDSDALLYDSQRTLNDARHGWPLRLWASPAPATLLPQDSHD